MSDRTEGVDEARHASPLSEDAELLFEDPENTVLRIDPDATARPGQPRSGEVAHAGSDRFQVESILGAGGMAIVHAADHVALRRTVAIKTLPNAQRRPQDIQTLVREARTTARLEHPNIVPVYDLDHDERGVPFIVMKRVAGESWRAAMRDESKRPDGDSRSLFEWNMSVIDAVCDALRFAHGHGVLHRDLKPDNVMVGAYGEVYVVDWGIAIEALPDTDPPFYPVGSPWVGSPAYMAPEMITFGTALSPRTDVYQIGGMLFEMLTGKPPHAHRGREAVEASIRSSPPTLPAGVDEELAAIVSRAMALDPQDRYASVAELQRALREHATHRTSRRLALAADPNALHAAILREDDEGVRARFRELRATLQLALEEWPQNGAAHRAIEDATDRCARFELRRGRPEKAHELIAMMDSPEPALVDECQRILAKRKADLRRGQESDPLQGAKARVYALWVGGVVAILSPLVLMARGSVLAFWDLAGHDVFTLALIALFWTRRGFIADVRLHRNVAVVISTICFARLAIIAGHGSLGLDATGVLTLSFLLWSILGAGLVAMLGPRLLVSVAAYIAAYGISILRPEWIHLATSFGHLGTLVAVVWHYRGVPRTI